MLQSPPAPETRSILDDLPFTFARASLGFRKFNDLSLRAVGLESLAPGLASVLHALDERGACAVNQLVEATQLPNGTLTGLLDTLEREGHIQRTRNPEDGRSRIIQLTSSGHSICERLKKRHEDVMAHLELEFSSQELEALSQLLERFNRHMQTFSQPHARL
jgi:DNA-binding MarR family transcriptional regulator